MGEQSVTLKLPEELYERVREAADATNRSVERVLLESIDALFKGSEAEDLETSLAQLATLTDEELWAVAYQQLTRAQSLCLRRLSRRSKHRPLSEAEQRELESLLELVDHHMLLRSKALLLLKQRGHDVESYLFKSSA